MEAEEFKASVHAALQSARENVDAFRVLDAETDAGEVLRRFDSMLAPLNGLDGRVGLFVSVHPSEEMRTTCEGLEREMAQFGTELSLDRGLFDRLAACEGSDLGTDAEKRILEHGLRDFRRSGVDRDEPTRERLRSLKEELVEIGQDFDRNIVTGGAEYIVQDGHAGLLGLPPDFLASHPEREDGTVLLSTDPADRVPVMMYAQRDDVRREYFRVSMQRAAPENLEILENLIAKRHELAQLLGFKHWADYVTEDKMTKTGQVARDFVDRVLDLVQKGAHSEHAELLEEKRKDEPGASTVGEWQSSHLTERVKRARFGFDSQSVRPYFSYAKVKQGVLDTSAALYGVTIERDTKVELWHPSVECYNVVDGDGASSRTVARFYLDMHPRDNKYKHAAMFPLGSGVVDAGVDGEEAMAEACLVCNFPEPSGDDPALLLHDEVTTFFHEVGHLLHHLFAGRKSWWSFSGIATEHDFVEVPSQMYEEWAWDADVLATFAHHHETGEAIPSTLVEELRRAQEYGRGLRVQGQMLFANLSLTLYDRDPKGLSPLDVMNELRREILPFELEPENYFVASFGHLHGYSAMYYTYMWSLVIAKDCFSAFDGDLMNRGTADLYRSKVLAQGGTRDAGDLVEDFLGRPYAYGAFESWLS